MIGKIILGRSFKGCINYCLHDKLKKDAEEQIMKNRAEVFLYNKCFGDAGELIKQFNELRQHNQKLSKPVMHITLSLAPGEIKSGNTLSAIAEDTARHLGFEENMFIAVLHKDTSNHQHLHLVVNRVGFDGKTLSDSNNYKRMADCCRKLELKHKLQQVLSPRRFLSQELRNIPRHDIRKEQLKQNIITCLQTSKSYCEFENKMKALKYDVIKERGVAFMDKQKVYTKGSEVGYSLMKIEKYLALQLIQRNKPLQSLNRKQTAQSNAEDKNQQMHSRRENFEQSERRILEQLLKPEEQSEQVNPLLVKRKKKPRQRTPHL
ncbi:relaxase/mobilization nuclease domain-containing protein [Parafilimonas sp.]|uniref:relaxase/mobilization nuclease domain-containing protein n=1 Tax=Parafilimonas sp. TaxID=1969739 RepID=UPI003F80FC2C